MTKRQSRMMWVGVLVAGIALAATLGFRAFRSNMMYFYTPSDLVAKSVSTDARVRLGGLVEKGSVQRGEGLLVSFTLADCAQKVLVRYEGILPDLFREGQGIVAAGQLSADGSFKADEVLAKHDENYMPPELASSLKSADGKHSCEPFKSVMQSARADESKPAVTP